LTDESVLSAADEIADQLQETLPGPREKINLMVQYSGLDFVRRVLEETLEIWDLGGMLVDNASRRRTLGGIFFFLAKQQMTDDARRKVFPPLYPPKERKPALEKPATPPPELIWEERDEILQALLAEAGAAQSNKVTLTGRPQRVDSRKDHVIFRIREDAKQPAVPRGVPRVMEALGTMLYTVYAAPKQWKKVEAALSDVDDLLIIEGTCAYDPRIPGVAVYASTLTTRALQREKYAHQNRANVPE
jgi:hypothetical protein